MSEGPDVVKMIREIIAANPMGRTSVTAELLIMLLEEIERLREKKEQQHAEIGLLLKRIEEFENRTLMEKVDDICEGISDTHIITTGQIRAAWGVFTKSRQAIRPFNVLDFEEVFRQLGIVRCECEREIDHWTEGEGSMTTVKCPGCNDDGFKIGGEDD